MGYKDEKKVYYFIRCLHSINKGIGVNKYSFDYTLKDVASILYNLKSDYAVNDEYDSINEIELFINICEKFYSIQNQNIKCIRKLEKSFKFKSTHDKHIYNFKDKVIKRLLLINIIQMSIKNNKGMKK